MKHSCFLTASLNGGKRLVFFSQETAPGLLIYGMIWLKLYKKEPREFPRSLISVFPKWEVHESHIRY